MHFRWLIQIRVLKAVLVGKTMHHEWEYRRFPGFNSVSFAYGHSGDEKDEGEDDEYCCRWIETTYLQMCNFQSDIEVLLEEDSSRDLHTRTKSSACLVINEGR